MTVRTLLAHEPAGILTMDIASNPITTGAWTVVGILPSPCDAIAIDNTSDAVLLIAKGLPGFEVTLPIVIKACEESVPLPFPLAKGVHISVKAVDHNVSTGDLVMNLFK